MLPAGAFQTRWGVLPPHVIFVYTPQGDSNIPTSIFALIRWVSAPSEALIRQETGQTKTKTTNEGCGCRWLCRLPTPGGVKPPLGRKVTTADADHCRTLKAIGSAEDSCCALNRLQWERVSRQVWEMGCVWYVLLFRSAAGNTTRTHSEQHILRSFSLPTCV